ncbi:unnamed protein product [Zymoseptoria tritici ST99CH_1A5]|uniref:Uncharacterized protein n=2 Tax=Zymoseptoria tritici TaxID=1047171 RepID=A0A2H1GYL5_ZYMTR|nr:unnamed protein product [Zymoseptoria tritici ST99CH_1E4]SMY27857.1 unnamed protein product [Zymoseptoria tritici ST99CH_1A5]
MKTAERRGSFARAFDRVRSVMKRKRNATSPDLATPMEAPRRESVDLVLRPATAKAVARGEQTESSAQTSAPTTSSSTPKRTTMDLPITVDPDYESEEALLPMVDSRSDIRDHHIQELFSRHGSHGSQFRPHYRDLSPDRPTKIRRVEKPIRIRIHWTCHQCDRNFGREQTCVQCGHQRCKECPRQPPKQVRAMLDSARCSMERDERERLGLTSDEEEAVAVRPSSTASSPAILTSPIPFTSAPLDIDSSTDEQESTLDLSFYTRPRSALRTSIRSTRQPPTVIHQMCHECEAPLLSTTTSCPHCNHTRCENCPAPASPNTAAAATQWIAARRALTSRSLSADNALAATSPPMLKAVRRVYRKPRQRVRYNCEHCGTMFIAGDPCRECGHERCGDCLREPPRRTATSFDPELLALVNARLAAHAASLTQPVA